MSLQPYVEQLKSRIYLDNKKQFTEAYNVPIQKDSDIDDFDTKLHKSQLKSLLKYLQSLKLDDIPIAGGPAGIKIRSAQDKDTEIRAWAKENSPDIKISFGQGSIGKGGGVKISESTQELMVAALVLNKVKSGNIDEVAAIEMIEEAKIMWIKNILPPFWEVKLGGKKSYPPALVMHNQSQRFKL